MKQLITTLVVSLMLLSQASAQEVKNIIYLIGDGMGLSTVSMMQLKGGYEPIIFDRAENIALQRTYSLDNRVTDSAASGTALATGSKTNNTFVGCNPEGEALESLMELAAAKDMATGIVVTTYLQHATPAVFYAHVTNRHEYVEISRQLLDSELDVAIGGGMTFFEELYGDRVEALRAIEEHGFSYADSMEALCRYDDDEPLLALLGGKEVSDNGGSYLADATREAIRLLSHEGGDEGFVLMVEGSLIDGAGHGNDAAGEQREMLGFMQAIEVAVEFAEANPGTLVVVTSDHETGGLSIVSSKSDFNLSEQGVEYRWSTDGHSGVMVPIYLYGTGVELINGIMENAELGARLKELITRK